MTTFPPVLPPKPVHKLTDILSQGSGCFLHRLNAFTMVFIVRTMAQYWKKKLFVAFVSDSEVDFIQGASNNGVW